MNDPDRALSAYESALRHNPYSTSAFKQIGSLLRNKEQFKKAAEYYQRFLNINQNDGEVWCALGYCYLMTDDLTNAYTAYQQALYHLPDPKSPKLWYGIGLLYERYESLDHAEEAFAAVIRMDPNFEKANEIYFRLGIIYKQLGKYDTCLDCFRYVLTSPPKPLSKVDILYQMGLVHEKRGHYELAKEVFENVLNEVPNHAKALQQIGALYYWNLVEGGVNENENENAKKSDADADAEQNLNNEESNSNSKSNSTSKSDTKHDNNTNHSRATKYLLRAIEADQNDPKAWYLLGRSYMSTQQQSKAYEAFEKAVHLDARNPAFWCSIGVLYIQTTQYHDAHDAFGRAIKLNPYFFEVWYNMGILYEFNSQFQDAVDAYQRALGFETNNSILKSRVQTLKNHLATHSPKSANSASSDGTPSPTTAALLGPPPSPIQPPMSGVTITRVAPQVPPPPAPQSSEMKPAATHPQQQVLMQPPPPPPPSQVPVTSSIHNNPLKRPAEQFHPIQPRPSTTTASTSSTETSVKRVKMTEK